MIAQSYIGRNVPRREDRRLLGGEGCYVDDLQLPRMLHAAILRSPHAHARIVSTDLTTARLGPGVVTVLAGADVADIPPRSVATRFEMVKVGRDDRARQ